MGKMILILAPRQVEKYRRRRNQMNLTLTKKNQRNPTLMPMTTWRSKVWTGKIWKRRHYMKTNEKTEIHHLIVMMKGGQVKDLHLGAVAVTDRGGDVENR